VDIIGELIAWRGAGALCGFFLAIYVAKFDPRSGMVVGFLIQAWSGWIMMGFDMNTPGELVSITSWMQGLSVGVLWVPLVIATFATLDPRYLAETSSVFHLMRNLGSSLFISLSVTTVIRSGNANYARMTEFASPYHAPIARGLADDLWSVETVDGAARLAREIARQASMLAYLNAFGLFTLACLAALPLILMVRVRSTASAPQPAPQPETRSGGGEPAAGSREREAT